MAASFYDQVAENKRNSYILIALVFALAFIALYAFSVLYIGAGDLGFYASIIFSAIYIAITYFFSTQIVLQISGAREAQKGEFPYLVNIVDALSTGAGIPAPKIYVIDDPAPNAFAVGTSPKNAAVAFTTGLLSIMNREELEGVAAHEISHIRNYDSRMATIAVVMVGLIALISEIGLRVGFRSRRSGRSSGGGIIALIGLLIIVLAPIVAHLVRLALSRQREYLADASGVALTRYPPGLQSALAKIKRSGSVVQSASDATASLYFANPMSFSGLFSTHPPIDERIRRLGELDSSGQFQK
ncbi:MAG: M48 family metalloprotease [Candidatus Anstonellaceae archaeon]